DRHRRHRAEHQFAKHRYVLPEVLGSWVIPAVFFARRLHSSNTARRPTCALRLHCGRMPDPVCWGNAMDVAGNAELTGGARDRGVGDRREPDALARTPLPASDEGPRMARAPLYPLRFEPIFTTNLWGGRR